jgi:hypothetical protein
VADPRPWKPGDHVRAYMRAGGLWHLTLSEREAEEMNNGENPLYPWKVERFVLLDEDGNEVTL